MNGRVVAARRLILVPRSLHERSQIVQCDAPIDLRKGALDDVLEISGAERATAIERQQMSPRLRCEATALVRTKDPEAHRTDGLSATAWET